MPREGLRSHATAREVLELFMPTHAEKLHSIADVTDFKDSIIATCSCGSLLPITRTLCKQWVVMLEEVKYALRNAPRMKAA